MLSKFFVLALGALAFIGKAQKASSQPALHSRSINNAETVPTKQSQTIVPGKYKINNIALGSETLRSRFLIGDLPIFVAPIPAGAFEEWVFEECEASLTYKITNVGFKASVYASKGEILVGRAHPGDCWYLERMGPSFLIKVPGQAVVWATETPVLFRSNVQLKSQRWSTSEVWNLTKIEA